VVNPYTDPNRPAQQAAQRAQQEALRQQQRSQEYGRQATQRTLDQQRKIFDDNNRRAARYFSQTAPRKRGGLLGFIIFLGLVALAAKMLGFF